MGHYNSDASIRNDIRMERRTEFCSRCGKKIAGACLSCYAAMREDLRRRQAIAPGQPTINGEFRMPNAVPTDGKGKRWSWEEETD